MGPPASKSKLTSVQVGDINFIFSRSFWCMPRCKRQLGLYFRRVQILFELEIEGRFAFQGKLDGRLLYKAMMRSM